MSNLPAKNNLMNIANKYSSELDNSKIFIDTNKNKVTVSGTKDNAQVSVNISACPSGFVKKESMFNIPNKKSDLRADVINLYEQGYNQTEIAAMLGISQAYVSKLLK